MNFETLKGGVSLLNPIRLLGKYQSFSFNLGLSLWRDLLNTILPFILPLRSSFCSPSGMLYISWHSWVQQPSYLTAHSLHWINNRWQPSFLQFVWSSQGLPHWWHWLMISVPIFSPSLLSNTKFFPLNLLSSSSSFTLFA